MNIETARSFFLWCSVINYSLLVVWVVVATAGRKWCFPLTNKIFRVDGERFDALNYSGIVLYKTSIFLFNIVPCLALYIIK